jgi:hypothetical protein
VAARPLEAPRTGQEFENAWGLVAGQPAQQLQLLKARSLRCCTALARCSQR